MDYLVYYKVYYGPNIDDSSLIIGQTSFSSFRQEVLLSVTDPNSTGTVPTPPPVMTSRPPFIIINPNQESCFSGHTTVDVLGRGEVFMKDLRVGDRVEVSKNNYQQVYTFGHRDTKAKVEFFRFLPSDLEVSKHHLVFIKGKGAIPASMVKVGDEFSLGGKVDAITTVLGNGIFAPFTPSGTIVVNGVLASNYISLQNSDRLMLGTFRTPFTFQWLDHSFQTVHRFWCCWMGFEDRTLKNGLSEWSDTPYRLSSWLIRQPPTLILLVLLPLLVLLSLLNVAEFCLHNPLIGSVVLVSICYHSLNYFVQDSKTKFSR